VLQLTAATETARFLLYIYTIAGTFILVSLVLGVWVHPYWFFFAAFVGANLFQYGLSKFCPLGVILKKLGVPETALCKEG